MVDFALNRPVPQMYPNSSGAIPVADENEQYLRGLETATDLAQTKQTVLIVPTPDSQRVDDGYASSYTTRYAELLKNHPAIRISDTGVLAHPIDQNIRHLRFYAKTGKTDVTLAMPILATVYYRHGATKSDELVRRVHSDSASLAPT